MGVAAAFWIASSAAAAWGCSFDGDCKVGSKCVKRHDAIYGVCAGGMSPGNDNDRQPVSKTLDPDGTFGNTCSFDIDCGVKNRCLKREGRMAGVCIPRRR